MCERRGLTGMFVIRQELPFTYHALVGRVTLVASTSGCISGRLSSRGRQRAKLSALAMFTTPLAQTTIAMTLMACVTWVAHVSVVHSAQARNRLTLARYA
eukprot:6189589-Pleurochrysis_carterae.AAC.2